MVQIHGEAEVATDGRGSMMAMAWGALRLDLIPEVKAEEACRASGASSASGDDDGCGGELSHGDGGVRCFCPDEFDERKGRVGIRVRPRGYR